MKSIMCKKKFLVVLLFLIILPVFAQERVFTTPDYEITNDELDFLPDFSTRGKYLTVKIAVAGPGDELYLWWGHIGIIVEDALTGENLFFDWGVFSFNTENFFLDFAFGRLFYSCMVSPADYALARMIRENRDVTLYTLDLPPEAKMELFLFAENNVRPENRNYLYHHFKDNCATRVRDIIDRAVGGSLKTQFGQAPGRFTFRQHGLRHTWFSPFWGWSLSFLMGEDIDHDITVWDEMFLPSEIAMHCSDFRYTDTSGMERQLVSKIEVLHKATDRPAAAESPPKNWMGELILGLSIALVFGLLKLRVAGVIPETKHSGKLWYFKTAEGSRYVLGVTQAAAGLFFGSMGFLLFFMSFFTTHDYTYHNANLLFVNPLLLAAVPLGLLAAFSKNPTKRQKADRLLELLWTVIFLGGILSIVICFFPTFYQQNQPAQAVVIPIAFVLSAVPL